MPQSEGPAPAPPAIELQSMSPPPPVQPDLNQSGPSNPAPDQVQPYAGKPRINVYLSVI